MYRDQNLVVKTQAAHADQSQLCGPDMYCSYIFEQAYVSHSVVAPTLCVGAIVMP